MAGNQQDQVDEELRVLMIEDDSAVAEMYRLRLSADGYGVTIARTGEEGLKQAIAEVPDLIYLDLRLPGMDGFEVLQQLRSTPNTAEIPVVILSNFGRPELVERGLKLGALEFLIKADTTPARLAETAERWTQTTTRASSAR
jgi:DNA-binding response OmpR family regulator